MIETPNSRGLSEDEIREQLSKRLPAWRFGDGVIFRKFKTHSWKGTLLAVNAVGHLAEVAWHHPEITLSYGWLEVRLSTHSAHGITEKDFALAQRIEAVLLWQPGKDDGPLDGTPADPRFAYMKYD